MPYWPRRYSWEVRRICEPDSDDNIEETTPVDEVFALLTGTKCDGTSHLHRDQIAPTEARSGPDTPSENIVEQPLPWNWPIEMPTINASSAAPSNEGHHTLYQEDRYLDVGNVGFVQPNDGQPESKASRVAHQCRALPQAVCLNAQQDPETQTRVPSARSTLPSPYYTDLRKKRGLPRKRRSKKSRGTSFLSLPGEIRNIIYDLVVPKSRVLIEQNRPVKEYNKAKKAWGFDARADCRPKSRLYHELDGCQIQQELILTVNLLLACKKVHKEVELFLYSRTNFCFASLKVIDKFISSASRSGVKAIEKAEICLYGYGNPSTRDFELWTEKYAQRLRATFFRFGQTFTGLRHLVLEIKTHQWPCNFTSPEDLAEENWFRAITTLAPKKVEKADVKFGHPMLHSVMVHAQGDAVREEIARLIENTIMSESAILARDTIETRLVLERLRMQRRRKREGERARRRAERKAEEDEERPAVVKILTINDIKADEVKKPAREPTRKLGLDKFKRVDLSSLGTVKWNEEAQQYL